MPFLDRCLGSVLRQSCGDFEFVIIDHESSDGSTAVLAAAAAGDRRIVCERMVGGSLGDALNRGLSIAAGRYIARMDADDVCLPDRLAKQMRYLESHPEIALVGSAIEFIDDNDSVLGKSVPPSQPEVIASGLLGHNPMMHPTVMARRDALAAVGGYRPQYLYCEDYDLWLRLAERYALANLPDVLVRYRTHPNSVSRRHYIAQMVNAAVARQAAIYRRRTGRDPTDTLDRLSVATLRKFDLTRAQLQGEQALWGSELFRMAATGRVSAATVLRRLPDLRRIALPIETLRSAFGKTISPEFRRHHGLLRTAAVLLGLAGLYPLRTLRAAISRRGRLASKRCD